MNFSKTNSITVFPKSCTSTNICIDTCLIEKKPIQPSFHNKLLFDNTINKSNIIVPL
jgi:hypothetical protein